MLVRQITHDDLGCTSHLVGDGGNRVAAVADAKLDEACARLVSITALRAGFGSKLAWLIEAPRCLDCDHAHPRRLGGRHDEPV
jgi:hypothetical protein